MASSLAVRFFVEQLTKLSSHKSTIALTVAAIALYLRKRKLEERSQLATLYGSTQKTGTSTQTKPKNKHQGNIDLEFVRRLMYILKKSLRSVGCRETVTAIIFAVILLIRTLMTLVMSAIIANFVKSLCNRDWEGIRKMLTTFSLLAIPTSLLNASLKFYDQALSVHIREKITLKVHELYMKDMNYYRSNKVGQHKLEQTDQLIADDIQLFSETLADVYSSILKPLADFIVFSLQLKAWLGNRGPLTMYAWFAFASWASAIVLPAYGKLALQSQVLEGRYRAKHGRLIASSEMIAFNGGEIPEKSIIDNSLKDITIHASIRRWTEFGSQLITGYLNKYAASTVGMTVVVLPLLLNEKGYQKLTAADIASYYVETSRIMGGQAEAVLALFEVQQLVGKLSGLTTRVYTLMHILDKPEQLQLPQEEENPPLFVESDILKFSNVNIYKPDGTLLVHHLSFAVPQGTRIIITGENGCGKSSLFRVLRGLWPLAAGKIESPKRNSLKSFYFLSQSNFVPIGTLREVIIYPHEVSDVKASNKTDNDLMQVLEYVHLKDLKVGDKKITLDSVLDWNSVLAPGHKQRLAFARLLYHSPQYAVLDECTNAITPNVEADIYERCRKMGITVFSISHKIELKKLHDYELHYDGKGGYEWIKLN